MELEKIQKIAPDLPKYWEGRENFIVRYYVYAKNGLNAVNDLKYLVAGIVAFYVVLKLDNPWWMLGIGLVSIPLLIVVGRWQLYRANKIQEYINTTRGSVLGYNGYNMQIDTLETLKLILSELQNKTQKRK